jgi:ParB family chromosome partitioning protein
MTPRKKRLGRGLDALLSKPVAQVTAPTPTGNPVDGLSSIPVEHLQRGQYQPRVDIRQDTLQELADSIQAQGVVQPIVVRPVASGNNKTQRYEIVAGERRWRAAQMAGLHEVPSIVREIPDESAIAMALIENIQREDLNPIEESRALERLIREFDLTHAEAAKAVGRSRAAVSNLLRLQELSEKVMPMLEARELEMGHARALLAITNPAQQYDAARQVVKNGMSVRETERLVRRMQETSGKKRPAKAAAEGNADIRRLEVEVSEKLGAKVRVDHTKKGSGKLVISYNTLDELDGILKHIK